MNLISRRCEDATSATPTPPTSQPASVDRKDSWWSDGWSETGSDSWWSSSYGNGWGYWYGEHAKGTDDQWSSWKSWEPQEAAPSASDPGLEVWQRVQGLLHRGHTVDRLSDAELQEVAKSIEDMRSSRSSAPAGAAATDHKSRDNMNAATEQPTKDAKDDVSAMLSDNKPDEPETKDERRKRLHRRNMRYYRSLSSSSPSCYIRISWVLV